MKIFKLLILIAFIGCDTAQNNRLMSERQFAGEVSAFSSEDEQSSSNQNDQQQDQANTEGQSQQEITGFEHCNTIAKSEYNSILGYFGVCFHKNDEQKILARMPKDSFCMGTNGVIPNNYMNPMARCGACFVPMHVDPTTNQSFSVGIVECVQQYSGNTNFLVNLRKTRTEQVNAVMVFHREIREPYLGCSNAYGQFLSQCYGGAQNPACIAQATSYANTVCTSFRDIHKNNYNMISRPANF